MSEKKYSEISILEVEIKSFGGPGLKVKYDLEKHMISWNDGYAWGNNFMKSINDSKYHIIISELPDTEILNWIEKYENGELESICNSTACPSMWRIEIKFFDGTRAKASGENGYPNTWSRLKSIIEATTECSFRLR